MTRTAFYSALGLFIVAKAQAVAQIITIGATTFGPIKRNGHCPVCHHQNGPIKAQQACTATLPNGDIVPAQCQPVPRACENPNCGVLFMQQPEA